MKMILSFVLSSAFGATAFAKDAMTCRQITPLTNILKSEHALTRDPSLRDKLLNDHAFAESLRTGFIEELDSAKLLFLADEVARARRDLAGAAAERVFVDADCGAFDRVFTVYTAAIERSLRLLPKRTDGPDALRAEVIAEARRDGVETPKHADWATTDDELRARLKDLLVVSTRVMASSLAKGGARSFDEAYDMARLSVDRFRLKTFTAADVPRLMTNVIIRHLDPHTSYFTPEEFNEFLGTMHEFMGLGVEITPGFGGVYIHSVLPNGPAARTGALKDGDKIVKVDGQPIAGMDVGEVTKLLRGSAQTHVKVEVVRASEAKPVEVDVERGRVSAQETTRREVIDTPTGPVGYLKFASFGQDGARAVIESIKELEAKNIRGLVLDLRGNPGGMLNEAVEMIEHFESRAPARATYYLGTERPGPIAYTFDPTGPKFNRPVIVLVDGASASASEIVAGALQSYGRALVVGDGPTFGKGSVQHLIPLARYGVQHPEFGVKRMLDRAPSGGLVLTSGYYFLPDGTSIQNVGITPDVVLYPERAISTDLSEKGLYEHSLPKPADLGGRVIPQEDVDLLKPMRARMEPARQALTKAFADKKDDLRRVNPQDPEKAASIFLLEELIKRSPQF